MQVSNPLFYSFSNTLGAIITLFIGTRLAKQKILGTIRPNIARLSLIGTLQGATYTTYLMAIAAGPIAYVSALRGSNILMGSVLGIVLLHEKLTKAKLLSFSLILVGAILLALGS